MAVGTTNVGFEDKLWLAADKLRGSMDASEYKHDLVLFVRQLKSLNLIKEEYLTQLVVLAVCSVNQQNLLQNIKETSEIYRYMGKKVILLHGSQLR